MKKVILLHAGNRDFYQVALALQENGSLHYLVTDDYRMRKQKPEELSPFVKTAPLALFFDFLTRASKKKRFNRIKDVFLSRYGYTLAKRNLDNVVFSYSYYANYIFSRFAGTKILFQLHPHPASVRKIFQEEIEINPAAAVSLSQEHELLLSEDEFAEMVKEPKRANQIIVASGFTKRTLVENGVDETKITVVPYGVDHNVFVRRKSFERKAGSMRVIFVGSLNQRKGLSYLASALRELQDKNYNIEFIVSGRGIIDKDLVLKYDLKNVSFRLNIPREELVQLYHSADLFVFPSLCEGFGHVILEAMSCGVPVLTTPNTSGPDIITGGEDGFIVPVRNVEQIVQRISELYHDPAKNIAMGVKAANTASQYTWENFRKRIIEAIHV